jgi:hypothetical protein
MAHLELAFIFTRYFVPIFMVDSVANFDSNVLNLYTSIIATGAVCYVIGLIMGNMLPLIKFKPYTWQVLSEDEYTDRVIKLTRYFFYFGVAGFIISYAIMGFIPMFASEPLNAKFFRGQYQAPYMRAAILFRIANYVMYSLPPLLLVIWYERRKKIYLLYLLIVVLFIATTLTRGNILTGVLIASGVICAYKKHLFKYYIISTTFIFSLGSISFYLIGLITNNDALIGMYETGNIFETIALGAPDVIDHLNFLRDFDNHPIYTYGRTFYGGLIPGHYEWNPSVWALSVTNPTDDVNEITSGGLRLPLPLWGYVSFSWPGVVIISLISGIVYGYVIKAVKKMISETNNVLVLTVIILVYVNVYNQAAMFYLLNMYGLPVVLFTSFYMFRFRWK